MFICVKKAFVFAEEIEVRKDKVFTAKEFSSQEMETFFRERARQEKHDAFIDFLDSAGNEPPVEGDEVL